MYRLTLKKIVKYILDRLKGLTDINQINRTLQDIYNSKLFGQTADLVAKRFITTANKIDAKTWREAARINTKGYEIYKNLNVSNAVTQKIIDNASLIKTLPLKLSQQITQFIASETYKGLRHEEIAEMIQSKIKGYTYAKADLIARTESSKAMTALTEARSKDVGLNWYKWSTSDDKRVRNSHKHMHNVLIRWDDPPSPERLNNQESVGNYNAGEIYNCRCVALPIVTLKSVKFPAKVYYGGTIIKMSKAEFEKIF